MTAAEMLARDFATLPDLLRAHAAEQPDKVALAEADGELDYASLDALVVLVPVQTASPASPVASVGGPSFSNPSGDTVFPLLITAVTGAPSLEPGSADRKLSTMNCSTRSDFVASMRARSRWWTRPACTSRKASSRPLR